MSISNRALGHRGQIIEPFDLSKAFSCDFSDYLYSGFIYFFTFQLLLGDDQYANYSGSARTSEFQDTAFLLRSTEGTIYIHFCFNNRYLLAPASIIDVDRMMFSSYSVLQDVLM